MAGSVFRPANTPALLLCAALACILSGCKHKTNDSDAQLTSKVQKILAVDTDVVGQSIQVSTTAGVVTLTGNVSNDAQRTLAARDVADVPGVLKVVNAIGLSASAPNLAVQPPVTPQPPSPAYVTPSPKPTPQAHTPAPIERAYNPPPPQSQPEPQPQPTPVQPPPPPAPSFKTVTIASGNTIPVRVTQTLDSGTTQPDTTFSGVVASDIVIDGLVAIPAGANVTGHVDEVKDATHFKGSSLLTISLTNISRRGEHLAVSTDPYSVQGKGRGGNTAAKTGGGAAVGAILGGIFGGGRGAAIGAAAGAGAGAGSNAVTRGQQVQIASESVVRFHLSAPVSVRIRTDAGPERHDDSGLQPRTNL